MNFWKKISAFFANLRIQTQLIAVVSIGSIILTILFYYYTINKQNDLYNEFFEKNTSTLSETIKIAIELGASNEQYEALIPVFNWAQRDSSVKFIALLDDNNDLIVNFPLDLQLSIPSLLSKSKATTYNDSLFVKEVSWKAKFGTGLILIGFSTEQLTKLRDSTFRNISITMIIVLIATITLFSGLAFSITKPLNKLITVATDISKGDETKRADSSIGNIELKTLANSFNKMLDKLIETQELRLEEVNLFNESLEKQNFKLIELHEEKNELLGIVAHDLKNPLSSILLNAEMISNYFDRMKKDDVLETINKVAQTAKSMNLLISDLLDMNALESGNLKIEPMNVKVDELINDISSHFLLKASMKNIKLNINCQPDLFIFVDSFRLNQVLDNLISNAIKFSSAFTEISIKSYIDNGFARIMIKDQGPGISAEEISLLFKKFSRLSAKPTANESSTGLGLSIAKRLTEVMGGKIWCESEKGKGAEFYLEFPIVS